MVNNDLTCRLIRFSPVKSDSISPANRKPFSFTKKINDPVNKLPLTICSRLVKEIVTRLCYLACCNFQSAQTISPGGLPRMNKKKLSLPAALITSLLLVASFCVMAIGQGEVLDRPVNIFERVATFDVTGVVAEIVTATPDGKTLIYTDATSKEVGFVNISDPAAPSEIGKRSMGGEPTSVAVTPDGKWALVCV
jgi:DNA-binding beta-propeller fold protein YncE